MRDTYRRLIVNQVKVLASELESWKLSEKSLEERFNEKWTEWLKDIPFQHMDEINVNDDVEQCLTNFRPLSPSLPLVLSKLQIKSLEEMGTTLQLIVRNEHVKARPKHVPWIKVQYMSEWPVKDGQEITDKLLRNQGKYLQEMKQKPYHSDLASHLLHKLFNDIVGHSGMSVKFTKEYKVDMALTVCGCAVKTFQDIVDNERKESDPVVYLEREMRGLFLKILKDEYNQIVREVTAASAVCDLLHHSITKEVSAALSQRLADGMRDAYAFLQSKPALKAKVLLDIGDKLDKSSEEGFADCYLYLTDAEKSLHCWLERYTIQYCHNGKLVEVANAEVQRNMGLIRDTVSRLSIEFQQKAGKFKISQWLTDFHSGIQSTGMLHMDVSELQQLAGGNELTDASHFTGEIMKGLTRLEVTLQEEFKNLSVNEMSDWNEKPQDQLLDAYVGCTEQCPFCKEQCDLTNPNHFPSTRHSVAMHRPKCLGGYRWSASNEMVLEICTTAVGTDDREFRNCNTGDVYYLYKEYHKIYPQWSITADLSLEASLYWKWLLGHYASELAETFSMKKAAVPNEWKRLQWCDVKKSLKEYFNL